MRSSATGQVWRIQPAETADLRRDPKARIALQHPNVAPASHAIVKVSDGQWWLIADPAGPGLYLGGRRIPSLILDRHHVVGIGTAVAGEELEFDLLPTGVPLGIPPQTPPRAVQAGPRPATVTHTPPVSAGTPVHPTIATAPVPGQGNLLQATLRRRGVLPVALVGVAVLAVVAVLMGNGAGPGGSTGLAAAKRATVKLAMVDSQGKLVGSGSGVIVDETGLILTNAHVAAPKSIGQGYLYGAVAAAEPEVSHVLVGVVGARDDEPVSYAYRATTVSLDGYLDLAAVRVTSTADGGPLPADFELPVIPMGDSGTLATGDPLTILGFPGISGSDSLTVTTGVVSTFSPDARLASTRGWVDTDGRGAPGNSGGPVVDANHRLIGIFSQSRPDRTSPVVSGRFRPIEVAADVLTRGAAGQAGDAGSKHLPDVASVSGVAAGWGLKERSRCSTPDVMTSAAEAPRIIRAMFTVSGVSDDTILFLAVRDSEGRYLDPTDRHDTRWAPTAANRTCALFDLLTPSEGRFTAELWTDPAGPRPVAQLDLAFSQVSAGEDPGTGGTTPGLCTANLSPTSWYNAPNGVSVNVDAALGADGQPVLPAGRAQFVQPLGDAGGHADAGSADQQARAAVKPQLSVGRFPGFVSQRWLVVLREGRYYAVHGQHIPVAKMDENGRVVTYPQPCLLRPGDATLVSWHAIFRDNGGVNWQYDFVNGAGTWTRLG
ncbi:MAG: trypsin-like peptidase domain-containing protein [Micropruina sp.]